MDSPIRVLVLISSMDVGGAETFIMKVFRAIEKKQIMFDFLVSEHKQCFYDDEIKTLNGKIFYGEFKSKNPIKSFARICSTVKREQYKVVFRCSEHPMACLDLLAAKLGGAKVLIIRSTNTSVGNGVITNFFAWLFRPFLNLIATIKIAPSTEAGVWLFGKRRMTSGEVHLMNNGVDVEKFAFNQEVRDSLREEFSLEGKFVIGHVGRFQDQKNHSFLIDVFAAVEKRFPEAVLMLVGQGELEAEIRKQVKSLGLSDRVLFMGVRSDVNRLMMAMDVFVFPSLYEGMPNTVIEAQASGLPCIISDTITREVAITDLVVFQSLQLSPDIWAQQVLLMSSFRDILTLKTTFLKLGYDIKSTAEQITSSVLEGVRGI